MTTILDNYRQRWTTACSAELVGTKWGVPCGPPDRNPSRGALRHRSRILPCPPRPSPVLVSSSSPSDLSSDAAAPDLHPRNSPQTAAIHCGASRHLDARARPEATGYRSVSARHRGRRGGGFASVTVSIGGAATASCTAGVRPLATHNRTCSTVRYTVAGSSRLVMEVPASPCSATISALIDAEVRR